MQIKQIHIQNFKSIRELQLDVRRVNVFIGEPNTGKTNVLEALSLLSENIFEEKNLQKATRFLNIGDLFIDNDITKRILVEADGLSFQMEVQKGSTHLNGFKAQLKVPGKITATPSPGEFSIFGNGIISPSPLDASYFRNGIRRYIFGNLEKFEPLVVPYLNPPFGNNLPQIIYNLPKLYESISNILQDRDFKLLIRPVDNEIHLAKEVKGKLSSYPYQTISETWKRIMFLLAVLETNENQVLILDEPEANIFPFYNTQIAESIGLYNKNQFFLTTHNPYLLQSLIAKTPKDELRVFVTRMENFETLVHQLDEDQLGEALDLGASIFSNLNDLGATV